MNSYLPKRKKRPGPGTVLPVLLILAALVWLVFRNTDTITGLLPAESAPETTTSDGTHVPPATQEQPDVQNPPSGPAAGLTKAGLEPGPEQPEQELTVQKNSSVYETLRQGGFSPADIHEVVKASGEVYDLAKILPGVQVLIFGRPDPGGEGREEKVPVPQLPGARRIEFHLSLTETLKISSHPEGWKATLLQKPVTKKILGFQGEVKSSLWESASEAGLDSVPIYALADILGWQIDFDREVQPGDHWRLLVERTYVEDEPYGWGAIMVAEYRRGADTHMAIRFPADSPTAEYYTPAGDNMRGRFLKSPLRYSRISSGFQLKRFHPVLGINRPHYGVDYAAAHGTPVRAVGDGTITVLGRKGGNGKMIRVRHNSSYETAYKHLSRYGSGLKRGSRVKQGDVIGFVGSTGLATGPHLHFEFYENGKFTDPLGRKFPREEPIPAANKEAFLRWAAQNQQELEKLQPLRLNVASRPEAEKEAEAH